MESSASGCGRIVDNGHQRNNIGPMSQERLGTPEDQELQHKRRELAELEEELAVRELELAEVQADLVEFGLRSQAELDPRYEELANLNQRMGELLSRIKSSDS